MGLVVGRGRAINSHLFPGTDQHRRGIPLPSAPTELDINGMEYTCDGVWSLLRINRGEGGVGKYGWYLLKYGYRIGGTCESVAGIGGSGAGPAEVKAM